MCTFVYHEVATQTPFDEIVNMGINQVNTDYLNTNCPLYPILRAHPELRQG